jgi:hypothetical protein
MVYQAQNFNHILHSLIQLLKSLWYNMYYYRNVLYSSEF